MPNVFDQFDAPSAPANVFDQFDGPQSEPSKPTGGLAAAAKQAIGATIKGAGQAASDFIPGVTRDNPVSTYGQSVVDANPTTVQNLGDIVDSPWQATKEAVGNAAGSMGAMLGARAAGMGITALSPFAGPFAPVVAGAGQLIANVGPIAAAALPSYGGIRETQIQADPNNEADAKSKAIAALGAAAVGRIETTFGPQQWALLATEKGGFKALAKMFESTTLRGAVGKGLARGAAVESGEELVQNPVEQVAGYQDPTTRQAIGETMFGGAMGAIGGGALGGGMAGIAHRAPAPPPVNPPAAQPPAGTTTPVVPPAAGYVPPMAPIVPPSAPIDPVADPSGTLANPQAGALSRAAATGEITGANEAKRQERAATTIGTTNETNPVAATEAAPMAPLAGTGEAPEQAIAAPTVGLARAAQQPVAVAPEIDPELLYLAKQEALDVDARRHAIARNQAVIRSAKTEAADGRVESQRIAQAASNRQEILDSLPLMRFQNPVAAFESALSQAGITQSAATAGERAQIAKRIEAESALSQDYPIEQLPSLPNEMVAPSRGMAGAVAPSRERIAALIGKAKASNGARIKGDRLLDANGKTLARVSQNEAASLAPFVIMANQSPQNTPPTPALPVTPAAPIANDQQAESAGAPTTSQRSSNGNKAEVTEPEAPGREAQPAPVSGAGVGGTKHEASSEKKTPDSKSTTRGKEAVHLVIGTANSVGKAGRSDPSVLELPTTEKAKTVAEKLAPDTIFQEPITVHGEKVGINPVNQAATKAPAIPEAAVKFAATRTDDQLDVLASTGRPGYKEAAIQEAARRAATVKDSLTVQSPADTKGMSPKSVSGTSENPQQIKTEQSATSHPPSAPERPPADKPFDSKAWNKARDDRIKSSKEAGNRHLDQLHPSVEGMRGLNIYSAHDPKERGKVRTVTNFGDVVVHWADEYSAKKNSASPVKEENKAWLKNFGGQKDTFESWLSPSDLKDYVVGEGEKSAGKPPVLSRVKADRLATMAQRKNESVKKAAQTEIARRAATNKESLSVQSPSTDGDRARWFALGREVSSNFPRLSAGTLRPKSADFYHAANALGISASDAKVAWNVFALDQDAKQKKPAPTPSRAVSAGNVGDTLEPKVVVDDTLLDVASRDTERSDHKFTIERDAQGVMPRKIRQLDEEIASGETTLEEIASGWKNTRDFIRKMHGESVTLYRADAPEDERNTGSITAYFGDESLASKFNDGKRKARPYSIHVDDIIAVYAKPSGYYEFIVKIPSGGFSQAEQPVVAHETSPDAPQAPLIGADAPQTQSEQIKADLERRKAELLAKRKQLNEAATKLSVRGDHLAATLPAKNAAVEALGARLATASTNAGQDRAEMVNAVRQRLLAARTDTAGPSAKVGDAAGRLTDAAGKSVAERRALVEGLRGRLEAAKAAADDKVKQGEAKAPAQDDIGAMFDASMDDVFGEAPAAPSPAQVPAQVTEAGEEKPFYDPKEGSSWHDGRSAFVRGDERALPSYYTEPRGKNAKDWYRGRDWASANAKPKTDAFQENVSGFAKALQEKAKKELAPSRAPASAAASAAKNAGMGLADVAKGLNALFKPKPGTLGMGLPFNEDTYDAAKPYFQAGVAHFKQAGADIAEMVKSLIVTLRDQFGMDRETIAAMKPYVVRFMEDVKAGKLDYDESSPQKEASHDSPDAGSAVTVDQPMAEGQPARTRYAPARGAQQNRYRHGRADDRGVRRAGRRADGEADESQAVGDGSGLAAVHDGSDGNLAGRVQRVSADFRPGLGALTREGSWFDAAKRNIDLIELAIQIDKEKRNATTEEQAMLAKYVGFGASEIRNALFPIPGGYAKSQEPNRLIWPNLVRDARWKPLAERIDALPREWQQSILQSTQYAHYTSEGIIRSIWSAIQRLGFTGGNIFEPGTGIGSFSMLMPNGVHETSRFTGVEFDAPTALIARLLSPDQQIQHDDFIKRKFPKSYFDVNVGNPPFSQTKILGDPDYAKNGFMLHDFFFAKGIDLVRPGGLQVFVTSKGTMDKRTDRARKFLSDRADLIGAIRLPSTAFEGNAGTSVVTDVIFLKKRAPGDAPGGMAWGGLKTVETKDGPVDVNEYFADHPEMILGQQRISGNTDDMGRRVSSNGQGGEKYTVVSYDSTPAELDAKFAQAVENLPENVYSPLSQSDSTVKTETQKVDFDPSIKREGVVYIGKYGAIMRVNAGVGVPLEGSVKLSDKDKAWFKGYVGIRDLVQSARQAQVSDGRWKASLKALNKAYDAFRAEHGPIIDFRTQVRRSTDEEGNPVETESRIFKNKRLYREDYDASLLTSLEAITESGEIVKAPFLLGRTIGKPVSVEVKSVGDALAVSLDSIGSLDLADVGRRMKLDREETIEALGSQIYQTPAGKWQLSDEYLSGDVVTKLEEAEHLARSRPEYRRNVEALKEVQPEKLGPSQISAKLGASWIPESHVNEFAKEIGAGSVTFDIKTETWQVDGGNRRTERKAGAEYGTAARSASELLEASLNSRSIKVTAVVDKKTVTDVAATTAANEAAKKIKDKFKRWVWTDSDRASDLVEAYNKRFNNIAPRKFDGSHLSLPGVSLRFKLHPHQLRSIWRQIQTGDTYLAHAVGAGKTIEMIAGAMEQKRLGLIKKPMFVVPNHVLEQFSNEFMELYPLANIMVADDENFSAERRKAFIASATLNNPDAIIITHSAFKRIGVTEASVAPIRDEILADLEMELSDLAQDQGTRVRRSQLQQQIEAVTQRFDAIVGASGKDSTLKFEDIGTDFIYADEAHAFRKLDFHTAQSIKGIDPNGSQAAMDMYVKTRILEKARPGRAFVFASGTPVTNTMGELFTIMRFFAPEAMDRDGISTFDSWARQFGEVAPALEPNAAGKYELIERFAKFDNVPELMSRVRQFMDVLTSESLGALVRRPNLAAGKPNLNIVESNDALDEYMKGELSRRIETSKAWKPSPGEPNNPDPIVAIITDGRFAAIDPRFFGGKLEGESVITTMASKIVDKYHSTKGNVYSNKDGKPEPIKGSTQIVFYNLGFGEQSQRSRGFNSRAAFTKLLTDGGIPRNEIAWFDDANTDAKKEAVFKDMRSGKLKVLIGSAKKMGTGVNVQNRLIALHYQDPPWFPADVEQPHGRIIRQGNLNPEVSIEWYTTKGTYQSTMWQMVGRKQRFINQAFTGDKSLRSMDDLGEASLFEQAAAVASGDPRALQLAGLRQDVERFERLHAAHAGEQINIRSALRSAEWGADSAARRIAQLSRAFKAIGERYFQFESGKVGGRAYAKPGEYGQALKDAFNQATKSRLMDMAGGEPVQIGSIGDAIKITMEAQTDKNKLTGNFFLNVEFGGLQFHVTTAPVLGAETDAVGLSRKVLNRINGVDESLRAARSDLSQNETDIIRLKKKRGAPFEYQQEMAEKYGELKRLEAELQGEGEKIAMPDTAAPKWKDDTRNRRMAPVDGLIYSVATDFTASPSDRAIYGMAAEGKTAAEILSFIGKASRRPFNRYLANALRNLGASSSVTLDSQGGWRFGNSSRAQKYAAAYNPKIDTIALFTAREAERHVLHEFVHSQTLKAIAAGGPASVQMRGLFLYLKRNGTLSGQYGMSNLDEFVAEAFSNPKFQQALKAIPAPKGSTLRSMWEWFVRAVRSALGMKSAAMETALDRAMRAGAELMRENVGLTGEVEGARPSFAGESAQTAIGPSLRLAQKKISAGSAPDQVRKQTGWFKGADDKWRFEINDADAKLKGLQIEDGEAWTATSLDRVLDHPALLAAYPHLSGLDVQIMIGPNKGQKGEYTTGRARTKDRFGESPEIKVYAKTENQALSTLLHEIQHGIQSIEGFATGGNPKIISSEMIDRSKDLAQAGSALNSALSDLRATEGVQAYRDILWAVRDEGFRYSHIAFVTGKMDDDVADVAMIVGEFAKKKGYKALADAAEEYSVIADNIVRPGQGMDRDKAAYEKYRRLAGEVEARNVESRQGMTDEQRRMTPVESTQDVPSSDVIVVFNGKDAMSAPMPANALKSLPDTITINGIERPNEEGTTAWAFDAHESGEVPDGWYVHGRAGRADLNTDSVLQLTKNWNVGEQYAGKKGSLWLIKENPGAEVFDLSSDETADMQRVVDAALRDFERGRLPWLDDLESSLGRDAEESDVEDAVRAEFAPEDIVDSAMAYDSQVMSEWFADTLDYPSLVRTPNGGAVVFSRDGIDAVMVPKVRPDTPDIRYSLITDWADSPRMAPARGILTNAMHSDKSTSWLTPFNTQYHKAEKWAAEGKTGFKRVFDLGQKFLSDVSRFAIMAQDEAPTLFHEIRSVGDAVTSLKNIRSIGDLTGAKHKADIEAIASPLHDGTLYGGGSPMKGVIFSDAKLRADYRLTDRQIKLYHEALAAVNVSMDEMAKSVIAGHAKKNKVAFDREMTVGDMADDVVSRLEDLKAEKEQMSDPSEQERVDGEVADLREMDMNDEADALVKKFKRDQSDAAKAVARIDKTIEDIRGAVEKNAQLQASGYFPLMRFGKHVVKATSGTGKEMVTEFRGHYEGIPLVPRSGQYQANMVAAAIRAEHPDWTVTTTIENDEKHKLYAGMNMEALQLFAEHMDSDMREPLQEYFRETAGNRSVLKRLIHRKGTPGFDKDVRRTLSQFIVSNARHTSSAYHLADMTSAAEAANDDGGDIGKEAGRLLEYVRDPQEEAHALRGFLFFNFLGGSIASALVNLSQVPMMTFPYLTRYEGAAALAKRLAAAAKQAAGDVSKIGGALGAALRRAEQDGVTAPQEIHQLTATAANNIFSGSRGVNAALRLWGAPFAKAESFNRHVTFIAAFQIAEGMTPAQLAEAKVEDAFGFAEKAVTDTQGIYNKGNRMNVGRGAVGATLMTFKQFSIMYLELLKRMPRKQQLIMLGMLVLASGAGGLPFEEDIEDIIDTFGQWLGYGTNSKKWVRNATESVLGRQGADIAINGVLSQMGIDLHSRFGMQNLLPGSGALKQSSIDKGRDAAEFFGPAASVLQNAARALQELATGHAGRAALAVAPNAVQNAIKGADMAATGYAEDAKGRRTVPVNGMESFTKGIGFNPKVVADFGAIKRDIAQDQRMVQVKREEFTSAIADAILSGDAEARQQSMADMRQWNEDNPTLRVVIAPGAISKRVLAAKSEGADRFLKTVAKPMRASAREELLQ